MVKHLREGNHDFEIWTKSKTKVMQKVEEILVTEQSQIEKEKGKSFLKADKMRFLEEWMIMKQSWQMQGYYKTQLM